MQNNTVLLKNTSVWIPRRGELGGAVIELLDSPFWTLHPLTGGDTVPVSNWTRCLQSASTQKWVSGLLNHLFGSIWLRIDREKSWTRRPWELPRTSWARLKVPALCSVFWFGPDEFRLAQFDEKPAFETNPATLQGSMLFILVDYAHLCEQLQPPRPPRSTMRNQ